MVNKDITSRNLISRARNGW